MNNGFDLYFDFISVYEMSKRISYTKIQVTYALARSKRIEHEYTSDRNAIH